MEISQLRNICNISFGCISNHGNIKQFVNLIIYLYLCLMDTLALNQCLWQMVNSDELLHNELIYQEEYITISVKMSTLFGIKKDKDHYIYLLNFSTN